MAEADVPKAFAVIVEQQAGRILYLTFWVSCPFVARILFDSFTASLWLFVIGWCLPVPAALSLLIDKILERPLSAYQAQVTERVVELARERQLAFEERKAFYSSPEWKLIRDQVIKEEGKTCADCGSRIHEDANVTVDHKRPRSKSPELALSRENLRVVCRRCNSSKGASDWLG